MLLMVCRKWWIINYFLSSFILFFLWFLDRSERNARKNKSTQCVWTAIFILTYRHCLSFRNNRANLQGNYTNTLPDNLPFSPQNISYASQPLQQVLIIAIILFKINKSFWRYEIRRHWEVEHLSQKSLDILTVFRVIFKFISLHSHADNRE